MRAPRKAAFMRLAASMPPVSGVLASCAPPERTEQQEQEVPVEWSFTVEGPPQPKERPYIVERIQITGRRTAAYEKAVATAASLAGVRCGLGPCGIDVVIWMQDRRRRDLDNVLKAIMDGLQRAGPAVLADDCCTVVSEKRIRWAGVDKNRPRAEVRLWMM